MQKRKLEWKQIPITIIFIALFIISIILIIPIVLFNDIVFDRYKGWTNNYRVFAAVFKLCYFVTGIRSKTIFESHHDTNKQYVFVSNHCSYFDIPEILIGIPQPLRVLGKKGPDKIPIFGYYYKNGTVMVDRSSAESRAKSKERLQHYIKKGISILICPEGTFNMTNKPLLPFYDGAFKIAIENQINIKPLLILDTIHTLHYSGIWINNGHSRMVYLEEISVQGLTANDLDELKNKVHQTMEAALIRYNAAWIDNPKA